MALSNSSKAFLVVLLVMGAVAAGGLWVLLGDGEPAGDEPETGQPVTVTIPEGVGATAVADDLAEAGVIRSAWAFRLSVRFDERADQVHPGEHELRTGMSTDEVLEVITQEPERDVWTVTLPEGWTVDQKLPRLAEVSGIDEDEFVAALDDVELPEWVPVDELPDGAQPYEGLLAPDTYEFENELSPVEVLQEMVDQTDALIDQVQPPDGVSRYELLIIASLVEREAKLREEQPVIASVIYNRLDEPMRLQIDATVQYARGEHTDRLLFEDLEIDSDWNTYDRDGLPPTPIAAPGRPALQSAAEPDDTDYLYYVVDDLDTGSHAFAETKEEHDANVAEFRRMREEHEDAEEGELDDEEVDGHPGDEGEEDGEG